MEEIFLRLILILSGKYPNERFKVGHSIPV
jgi:hypothetical protein